jgi:hypothetical protein
MESWRPTLRQSGAEGDHPRDSLVKKAGPQNTLEQNPLKSVFPEEVEKTPRTLSKLFKAKM